MVAMRIYNKRTLTPRRVAQLFVRKFHVLLGRRRQRDVDAVVGVLDHVHVDAIGNGNVKLGKYGLGISDEAGFERFVFPAGGEEGGKGVFGFVIARPLTKCRCSIRRNSVSTLKGRTR